MLEREIWILVIFLCFPVRWGPVSGAESWFDHWRCQTATYISAISSYCKPLNCSISSIHKAWSPMKLWFFLASRLPACPIKGPPSAAVPLRCRGGAGETSTGRVAEAAGGLAMSLGLGSRGFLYQRSIRKNGRMACFLIKKHHYGPLSI